MFMSDVGSSNQDKNTQRQHHAELWRLLELDPVTNCNIAAQVRPLTGSVIQCDDEAVADFFFFEIGYMMIVAK